MSTSNKSLRFGIGVLASLLGCFGLQAIAFFGLRLGTGKTESNYFSTLSRFQGACAPGAEIAVSGSSITGRLPGREAGNQAVANLGSDGGSPYDGLKLIDEGVVSPPRWLVLETNTLFNGVGYAEMPAVKGARGLWFTIGGRVPLVGAAARPSGMLYARLLSRSWNGRGEPFPLQQSPRIMGPTDPTAFEFSPVEKERLHGLSQMLSKIRKSGGRILLVNYPAGAMKAREIERMNAAIAIISNEAQAPYLDLSSAIPRESLVFTDSVHLGPASASRILDTIRAACLSLETPTN